MIVEIGEIVFYLIYLIFIWKIVVQKHLKRKCVQKDESKFASKIFIGFFLLALGDTGYVGLRVVAIGLGGLEQNPVFIGLSVLSTFITIGILYVLFLEVWRIQFEKPKNALYYSLLTLGIIRYGIFLFPLNDWGRVIAPFEWFLIRNILLVIQGIGVAILLLKDARKSKRKTFKNKAYYILILYSFYFIEELLVNTCSGYLRQKSKNARSSLGGKGP